MFKLLPESLRRRASCQQVSAMKLGSCMRVVFLAAVSATIQDVLVTRVNNTKVMVWTAVGSTGEAVVTLEHDSKVIGAHVDGLEGVVTAEEDKVSVWTPAGAKIASFHGHRMLAAVNDKVVIAQNDTVTVWEISSRASLCTLKVGKPWVTTASIDPKGKIIAVQSAECLGPNGDCSDNAFFGSKGIQLWDIDSCSLRHNLSDIFFRQGFGAFDETTIGSMGFGASGRRHVPFGFDTSGSRMWVFSSSLCSWDTEECFQSNIRVYDTATGALVEKKYLGYVHEQVGFPWVASKSGSTIAILDGRVLEASTGKVIRKANKIVAISDEGDRFLTKRLTSWDITTATSLTKNVSKALRQLQGFRCEYSYACYAPLALFFHHGSWLAIGAAEVDDTGTAPKVIDCSSSPVKVVSVDTGDEIGTDVVGCLLDAHASTPSSKNIVV